MKKTRILAGVFALVMAGAMLTACGGSNEGSVEEESSSKTTEAESTTESQEETEAETEAETEVETTEKSTEPSSVKLEKLDIPVSEDKSPVLEEVGKISAGELRFSYGLIYSGDSEENIVLYDYMGKEFAGDKVCNVSDLGETGLFACSVESGDISYQRLITAEGEVIVDTDKKVGLFKEINKRFIMAFFPEEVTTDEDEAIYYATENMFSINPNDEDVLYKGKVMVFDTETKKFLENTTYTKNPYYRTNGDIISFYNEDDEKVYVSAEDKVIDVDSNYDAQGSRFFTRYNDGGYQVFDHDLNIVKTSDKTLIGFDENDYFVKIGDPDKRLYALADYNLEEITDIKYYYLNCVDDKMFSYSLDNSSNYGLLSVDGKELTDAEYSLISDVDTPGYYACKKADGTYDLINREGKVVDSASDGYYGFASKKTDNGYATLVANTGEFSIESEYTLDDFGNGLAYDSRAHVIYDIFTGDKLAEDFDKAYEAYGHIYVLKGDEITIYSVK